MNYTKSSAPIYSVGKSYIIPKKGEFRTFIVPFDDNYVNTVFCAASADGDVAVECNHTLFKFQGVQSVNELWSAFLYIMYKDMKSRGTYSVAARNGKWVYVHRQAEHVSHWLKSVGLSKVMNYIYKNGYDL